MSSMPPADSCTQVGRLPIESQVNLQGFRDALVFLPLLHVVKWMHLWWSCPWKLLQKSSRAIGAGITQPIWGTVIGHHVGVAYRMRD